MSPLAPACQRCCQISQCSGRPRNVARIHRAMAPEVGYVAFLKGAEPRRSLTHHNLCTARTVTIPGLAKRAHTFISLRDQTHARRGMHGSTGMHGEEQSASEMYRSMRGQRAGRSWPTACLALLGWSPRSVRCAARRADGASSPRWMVAAFGWLARQGGPTARTVRCAARRGEDAGGGPVLLPGSPASRRRPPLSAARVDASSQHARLLRGKLSGRQVVQRPLERLNALDEANFVFWFASNI